MTIRVEVVYALRDAQTVLALEFESGATVADAVAGMRARGAIPGGLPAIPDVGIWGVKVPQEKVLQDGDRVEIYRNLVADPGEARRQRAGLQKAARSRR